MFVCLCLCYSFRCFVFFFFKQKTAYEMRISDWSSDVCSSDLHPDVVSPKVGDWSVGDDGRQYIWVKSSAAIVAAAAPGTQVTITEPAMTAAAGSGGFYAPIADRKSTRLNSSH